MSTMERVKAHYDESLNYFNKDHIVGIFLQGSQNYGLETENSDVDTKLVVLPTFGEIVFNKKPVSTTHVRANDEHIDFKDVRLMLQTFRKQNLNFVEILFTSYFILNPSYASEWNKLVAHNEEIAHYSPYQAVKTMKGIAMEKYHAMEHDYPSKAEILEKYGYDPKQLHHLLRVKEYLQRYINGESYKDCLRSCDPQYLVDVKNGLYSLDEARKVGYDAITQVNEMTGDFISRTPQTTDKNVDYLLDDVQYNIMRKCIGRDFVDGNGHVIL